MALARLISKNLNLGRRVVYEKSLFSSAVASQQHHLFCTTPATDEKTNVGGGEVAVTEKDLGKKKGRRGGLWKKNRGDFAPSFNNLFPSSLGSALMQATDNINKLLHNFSPSQLIGRVKEKDDHYKMKFQLPGLEKEDVKITVEHGMLRIVGEHKEEEEDEDDEHWASSYGYYNTTLALPEDAKVDEIKAEMKHGVLTVIIPKSEGEKKNIKEVEIN